MSWDRRTPAEQAKVADAAVAAQLRDRVGPFSPFWRERLRALGLKPAQVTSVEALRRLPAVGEHDLCPDGDPAEAARLVLQGDEEGYALHVPGVDLRKALMSRIRREPGYRHQIDNALRPTTYTFGGLGLVLPIASTRDDLDVIARAGARLWSVLGLTASDVLVSLVPTLARVEHLGLSYAALGAGAPALFPGDDLPLGAETLRLVPATVLALPTGYVAETLAGLGEIPASVRTVLLVGPPPSEAERAAVAQWRALSVWGPADGRWLYGESEPRGGWVTYPDLEVWDTVDPVSGEASTGGGELVLTQLGVRGSALLRWRTGATVDSALSSSRERTVPVIPPSLATDHLVQWLETHDGPVCLDRRVVTAALAAQGLPTDLDVAVDRLGRVTVLQREAQPVVAEHLGVQVASPLRTTLTS